MATRLPIVIQNGQLQQLQPGDVLGGPTTNDALIQQALQTAWAGTAAAAAAMAVATDALTTAWTGTGNGAAAMAVATDALTTAWTGTTAAAAAQAQANQANAVATDALTTAWTGTGAAAAAMAEATAAYTLAVAGTNAATSDNTTISLTNDDLVAHFSGTVVYIDADDGAKQAKADSMTTAVAVAIATGSVAPAQLGSYRLTGILKGQSGLTPGSTYFLSPTTAGLMTTVAPTTQGQVVVSLGNAVSSTMFKVSIQPPILL